MQMYLLWTRTRERFPWHQLLYASHISPCTSEEVTRRNRAWSSRKRMLKVCWGLIGLISIKRKPCDLFLSRRAMFLLIFNQEKKYWKHQGQQSARETWCYNFLRKASWSKPFGARKPWVGKLANGAIGLTAPNVNMGGRVGLAKGKASIPALGTYVIHHNGLLFTFTSPNFKLFFTSGFCPDSLRSLLTQNRPSFVKSGLTSFSISPTLSKALL